MADATAMPAAYEVGDDRMTPAAARALARAVVLHERARAAAARRRRGFGVRPPTAMPQRVSERRRRADAA